MTEEAIGAQQRSDRRRKVTAILAGGLVLGVGAAVTLSAWNDSEFAKSTFAAGTFVFQGSTDGTTWNDHPDAASAASLSFTMAPSNLSPGDEVYAPYALQLTGSSSADLTAVAPALGGTLVAADLTFDAVSTSAFGCDDATDFSAGSAVPATMDPDDVVYLCLKVGATQDLGQGHSGDVVWQWNAASQ